jgi:hypothetical protein
MLIISGQAGLGGRLSRTVTAMTDRTRLLIFVLNIAIVLAVAAVVLWRM